MSTGREKKYIFLNPPHITYTTYCLRSLLINHFDRRQYNDVTEQHGKSTVRHPLTQINYLMIVIFQDDIPDLIWYAVAEIGALEDHIRSFAHAQYALLWSEEGKQYARNKGAK